MKLIAPALVVNTLLIAVAVFVANTGITALVLLPILALVSVAEIAYWRMLNRDAEEKRATPEPRMEAVRRLDSRRKASIIDDATGLYTRWYFDRRVEEEAARCKRYKHSMAVVVLKVDAVNLTTFSTDGWQKRALDAAQRAAKVIREVDISASLSPYEFAICLIHCDRDGAYRALDRMLSQLPDYNCEAGVAVYPDEGYEPSALVEVAGARVKPLQMPASA